MPHNRLHFYLKSAAKIIINYYSAKLFFATCVQITPSGIRAPRKRPPNRSSKPRCRSSPPPDRSGKDRRWLWAVANDKPVNGQGDVANINRESSDLIKKTYHLLDTMWQNYMQEGKINPVAGIFLAKNHFSYVDKTETVVTPNTSLATTDAATIEAKYRELPGAEDQRLLEDKTDNDYQED